MRTVIISVIGVSSILLSVMIHMTINEEARCQEELQTALGTAMYQTMAEVFEQNSYGIQSRNEMVAAFLQSMLKKAGSDMSLTICIHKLDKESGVMDVEAIGEYQLPDKQKKRISVRRKIKAVVSDGEENVSE